jgi:IclR family pca regulon transcriptional regulator
MSQIEVLDRDIVSGLEKGLAVIEAFDEVRPKLSLGEVAKLTGLTRAAARRYLLTLVKNRYAEYDGKFFWLSPRVLKLGYAYLSSTSLSGRLQPYLEDISRKTGESSSAAILDGVDIVYIARSSTSRIMAVDLNVGSHLPAYCSALGRALLAYDGVVSSYIESASLVPLTPKTRHTVRELREILLEVKRNGFALVDEELALGLRSIAVPIFNADGKVVTAINISVATVRASVEEILDRFLPILLATQEDLRRVL